MKEEKLNNLLVKLGCGAVAGITGTLIIYPLDAIKTRLQTSAPSSSSSSASSASTFSTIRSILRTEGPRKLYKGLGANLIGITPEKAIKLAVNDFTREYFAEKYGHSDATLPIHMAMFAGGFAGFCQVVVTNPMELVKIRLQMSSVTGNPASLGSVVGELGLRGLYRGTTVTLMRDVPFSFIFFPSSAIIRERFSRLLDDPPSSPDIPHKPSIKSVFLGGLLGGIIAAGTVTPADVIKTRFQLSNDPSVSIAGIVKDVYAQNGLKGFFRGWKQRCMIVAPLFGITMLVYETQQRLFANKK